MTTTTMGDKTTSMMQTTIPIYSTNQLPSKKPISAGSIVVIVIAASGVLLLSILIAIRRRRHKYRPAPYTNFDDGQDMFGMTGDGGDGDEFGRQLSTQGENPMFMLEERLSDNDDSMLDSEA
eukprot:m.51504 g.51504  ORF g.51504 m.51504 type:complete len:122 (-) comp11239_c3_seq1:219-584(-)